MDERLERDRSGRERGFLDRAGDEVRSWFGNEDAERRRRQDERERRAWTRESEGRGDGDGPDYPDYGYERRASAVWRDERGVHRDDPRDSPRATDGPWSPVRGREAEWPPQRGYGAGELARDVARTTRITRGRYTGRGPKGYRRSDARIQEDVCEGLSEHGDIDATEIEVTVADREVTLQGSVASRWEKRLAEDIAESVSGVNEVHNHLRVSQDLFGRRAG